MLPFKKIICPLDFSDPSFTAMSAAVELAGHFSAELTLIHVLDPLPIIAPDLSMDYSLVLEAGQKAEEKAHRDLHDLIKKDVPIHLQTYVEVRRGDPASEIVSFAEQERADIIVIATHGTTGWRHFVFGSVAEKVVQTAPCAVLTVHRPADVPAADTGQSGN